MPGHPDGSSLQRHAARTAWRAAVLAIAVALAALAVRMTVIEPAAIAHACDPAPWQGACALRTALTRLFQNQELGWLAFAAGALATLLRAPRLATFALASGAAGLVLYSVEPAAVGALLGMLVLVRAAAPAASTTITTA
jgi:hypothetical protein